MWGGRTTRSGHDHGRFRSGSDQAAAGLTEGMVVIGPGADFV
jgi:hypothetical protein